MAEKIELLVKEVFDEIMTGKFQLQIKKAERKIELAEELMDSMRGSIGFTSLLLESTYGPDQLSQLVDEFMNEVTDSLEWTKQAIAELDKGESL